MRKLTVCFIMVSVFFAGISFAQAAPVNPNDEAQVAELKADAEAGDRGAQYELSMVYAYKQDTKNSVKWLTESAKNGYGRAQYTLGNVYYNGSSGVKKDYDKAVEWFETSKASGFNGKNVDALIASSKQKKQEQIRAADARKKAADAEAKKKAATATAKTKTVAAPVEPAVSTVTAAAVESKSFFQRAKDKISSWFK